jgi:exoribonuclease-2
VSLLARIAHQAMIEHGLEPDIPPAALREADSIPGPAADGREEVRDLRGRAWCSIDDDDTRDLDQLTAVEEGPSGAVRVLVAVADVDVLVERDGPIDAHARRNTTSVYTAAGIFPMLPERLSTDLTSLADGQDRLAVVVAYTVAADGSVKDSDIFRAQVRNRAKLAYDSLAAWLDGEGRVPEAVERVPGLEEQVRTQDRVARALRRLRYEQGALDLETIEPHVVVKDGAVVGLHQRRDNVARRLIQDLMIAANGATARFLADRGLPSLRRMVRSPQRWDRIRALAVELGDQLPPEADARALSEFLVRRRTADSLHFPDLSLAVVKLVGSGEYVVQRPGEDPSGHFGLAVRDYVHSTAPNRRYPDVITQRLLKAALAGRQVPYATAELEELAAHCTRQEDAANRVERQVRKAAAALFLSSRIGETFDALVTGASPKATWVRTLNPPIEGRLLRGEAGREVGDRLAVRLAATDVERGYIDFEAA